MEESWHDIAKRVSSTYGLSLKPVLIVQLNAASVLEMARLRCLELKLLSPPSVALLDEAEHKRQDTF